MNSSAILVTLGVLLYIQVGKFFYYSALLYFLKKNSKVLNKVKFKCTNKCIHSVAIYIIFIFKFKCTNKCIRSVAIYIIFILYNY